MSAYQCQYKLHNRSASCYNSLCREGFGWTLFRLLAAAAKYKTG